MVCKSALIVCVVLLLGGAIAPSLAQSDSKVGGQFSPEEMYWNHNGSKTKLVAEGSSRKFYYTDPRPEIVDAGAKSGSLLFEGKSINGQYIGRAYIFTRRCGKAAYRVSGPILDDYRRVELQGQKPRVDNNCRVIGTVPDLLIFQLVEPSIVAAPPPTPFVPETTPAPMPPVVGSIPNEPPPTVPNIVAPFVPKTAPAPIPPDVSSTRTQEDPFVTDCDAFAASNTDPQRKGRGLSFDKIEPEKAIPACLKAISSYPNATRFQYQLGRAYEKNIKYDEAASWYRKAAEKGSAAAQYSLGVMYSNGRGVPKDDAQAVVWYRKAAEQGLDAARAELESKKARDRGSSVGGLPWVQSYGDGNKSCTSWTDDCVTCKRDEGAELACSNIGIACQPNGIRCLDYSIKTTAPK